MVDIIGNAKAQLALGILLRVWNYPVGVHAISRRVLGALSFLSLCIWRDVRSHQLLFSILVQNILLKQLKGRRVYVGSWFKGSQSIMAEKGQKLGSDWLELALWLPKIFMEQEVERGVLASSFLPFLNELVLASSLWDGAMYHQGKSPSSINPLWEYSHWQTQRCASWVP